MELLIYILASIAIGFVWGVTVAWMNMDKNERIDFNQIELEQDDRGGVMCYGGSFETVWEKQE